MVAVTGACAFLGKNLVGVLEEREDVERIVILDVASPPTAGRKSRAYRIDLTQPAISARITEILRAEKVTELAHLAFLSSPTTAEPWAHELESVGTMHVLHACRESPVERVVVSSQTMLYGPHPSNPNFLRESSALRGIRGGPSPFGRTFGQGDCSFLADKIDAEREVDRFAKDRPEVSVATLRFAPQMSLYIEKDLNATLGEITAVIQALAIPAPASLLIFAAGLAGLVVVRRRAAH